MDSKENILIPKEVETQLLGIVREFIAQFKTERALNNINLDAHLERDLGIDSLGRVELFGRIENVFSISFPETLMAEVETLRDIAKALSTTGHSRKIVPGQYASILSDSTFNPSVSPTLIDVLIGHAAIEPKRPHIYLHKENGEEKIIRYEQLLVQAEKLAGGLNELGLQPKETVAIMLPTSEEFFYAFFGILLAGGIPVPVYPPIRADKIEEYAVREAHVLNNAEVRFLITFNQTESLSNLLKIFIKSLQAVTTVSLLMNSKKHLPAIDFSEDDPALIQYTSGSTSNPKGVLLSHSNLLANIRAIGVAAQLSNRDIAVSWLPLYHDMGLIGAWLSSLYHGLPLVVMSPLTFLSCPERWLWAIHYHRATISAGPNFAYELCIRRIKEENIQGLDLSSWRLAFNGAEPVNPRTLENFAKKFGPYGFKTESLYPVYGLAESSVALTFPPLNRGPRIDVIEREAFETQDLAIPVEVKTNSSVEFVSCGIPLPNHEVRIVDENGYELPERKVGYLHFNGPSAMRGYFRKTEASKAIYYDGWWDSGDKAYIADEEVFITGRKKDIIIKAGRNLYPQEIEEVASQVTGLRKGCVVAFGVNDPVWGTEKLVVVAETSETKKNVRNTMISSIIEKVSTVLNIPPDEVVLVEPRSIPKTSSGKLQRSASKNAYLKGNLNNKGLPIWIQITKLFIKSLCFRAKRTLVTLGEILYTIYVAGVCFIFLPITWLLVMILPRDSAKKIVQALIRLFLFFSIFYLKTQGRENLHKKTASPTIYVSNHASYIDSLLLFALLPTEVLFVGKKEILDWPFLGTVFKKFEYIPVDRLDFSKSLSDAVTIQKVLKMGNSILIYPEGGFTHTTGLRPFKLGAFKLAVDTQTTLCPIALQGTRHFLNTRTKVLSPGRIKIIILPPILPSGGDWSEVVRLHAVVREVVLKHCGESVIDL